VRSGTEKDKFAKIMPNNGNIYKIAKQMNRSKQDVVRERCIKNDAGELSLSDEEKMKATLDCFMWNSSDQVIYFLRLHPWRVQPHQ
jgi:hypothetical protein